jgi:hypothetical protein
MQRFALTLALLLAVVPWPPPANAGENIQSTKKLGKNYFVVREPNSRLQGRGQEGEIMVGKSPYASEQYAEATIRTFLECKPEAKKDSKQ